jgi:Transposase DDE domain
MVTLKAIYRLAGRQCQGFVESLFELMGIELPVPDHSTVSRRLGQLSIQMPILPKRGARHLVVDSTGIKVYGEGEWKTRLSWKLALSGGTPPTQFPQHGISKRRTWRKLHLGIDEATGEILAVVVTTNDFSDGQLLPDLLDQIDDPIAQVSGDGAYDQRQCDDAIQQRQARATIPPHQNAKIWQHGNMKAARLHRDQNLRRIRQVGRKAWKRESNYHRRSLAETTMNLSH